MATTTRTFDVRNGLSVANTIIVSNASGIINVSNITLSNTITLNVSGNIANAGNVLVTQNIAAGNLAITQNGSFGNISAANISVTATLNTITLNVSGNIANAGNVIATQNLISGNAVITQNISGGNLSITQNASFGNIANAGNILVTTNVTAGNLSITQNVASGNISAVQNVSAGNVTATSQISGATGVFSGQVTIGGNLIVNGTTVTINASSVQTNDQYIMLASNNYADTLDVGFAALAKNTTQGNVYSGLVKHAADETWHLFEGYALMNAYPATINTAQTNVATLNANVIAQQITVGGINVQSAIAGAYLQANTGGTYQNGTAIVANISNINFVNTASVLWTSSANGGQTNATAIVNGNNVFANNSFFVNGTIVANSPNLNIVSGNTSNLSIVGSSNTSPGNVTITIDTRLVSSGGGGAVNAYANSGLITSALDNIAWLNSQSILYSVTQNASEIHAINVQPVVNSTLNLTSLNVSSNIANAGNISVTQNIYGGNILISNVVATGIIQTTAGNVTVNTLAISVNSVTLATVSQSVLDNFSPTGTVSGFSVCDYDIVANCANSFHATTLRIMSDGTNVYVDEFGTMFINGPVATFTAALTTGNVQVLATGNNATSTIYRTVRRAIQA